MEENENEPQAPEVAGKHWAGAGICPKGTNQGVEYTALTLSITSLAADSHTTNTLTS